MPAPSLHRRALLAGGAASGLAWTLPAHAADADTAAGAVRDLMPEFWRFYDAGAGGGTPERAGSLASSFFLANAGVYAAAGFGAKAPYGAVTQARLADWLQAFDPLAADARRVSEMLPDAWRAHEGRFRTAFPAYRADAPACLLVSVFAFDVDARPRRGREPLFVGVDGVAKAMGETQDLNALLDQAAFRLFQLQANPQLWPASRPEPLWVRLWREGLAAYVGKSLNPAAPPPDASAPSEPDALAPGELRPVAGQALAALETTDAAEAQRILEAGREGDIPARSGYVLGLRLAERAGRSLSLDQLARLPAQKVHRFMRQELSQIAHG